jgi:hypothetical protein
LDERAKKRSCRGEKVCCFAATKRVEELEGEKKKKGQKVGRQVEGKRGKGYGPGLDFFSCRV